LIAADLSAIEPFLHQYGALTVFASVFIEAIGGWTPSETLVVIAALLASSDTFWVWNVVLAGWLGAVAGGVVGYVLGLRLVRSASTDPQWRPKVTDDTQIDEPDQTLRIGKWTVWAQFAGLAVAVGFAGYLVAQTGLAIAARTGLSESLVGTYLTAIVTSLPSAVWRNSRTQPWSTM
jgi:cation:H+ antiporter